MAVPLTFTFVNPNTPKAVESALREILLEKLMTDHRQGAG